MTTRTSATRSPIAASTFSISRRTGDHRIATSATSSTSSGNSRSLGASRPTRACRRAAPSRSRPVRAASTETIEAATASARTTRSSASTGAWRGRSISMADACRSSRSSRCSTPSTTTTTSTRSVPGAVRFQRFSSGRCRRSTPDAARHQGRVLGTARDGPSMPMGGHQRIREPLTGQDLRTARGCDAVTLEGHAVLHHEGDLPQGIDALERVSLDGDQI